MSRKDKKGKQLPSSSPWTTKGALWLIGVLQFVCPLLFFTNLTRNPYYTQIAMLNVAIALCGILWVIQIWMSGQWKIPRVPFEWPLLIFIVVGLISTVMSWINHPLLRVGIQNEGIRIWTFTIVNSVMAFYLPLLFTKPLDQTEKSLDIWSDIILVGVWSAMWFGFYTMKDPDPNAILWDPYGGFLWILALIYVYNRIKKGEALGIFHVIFSVAMLAGCYGLMQYMGRDLIWSSPVQPSGGRPVSTFGNPNFLSSYVLLVSPLALGFAFHSKGKQFWGYLLVAAVSAIAVLCTLTRSTYVGLLAAYGVMVVLLYKKEDLRYLKWAGIGIVLFIVLIFLFPTTPVTGTQSPLSRFTEIFERIESGQPYAAWHQRILIWSSAWDMVQERLLFGKGWGTFELFYPFYQGGHLLTDLLGRFRTHANNAHNVLMEMWAQLGFMGTGVALWLMVTMLWGGWIVFQKKSEGLSRFVCAGLLAGLFGMMIDNFFGNVSIFFAVPAFLFWWNAGSLFNEADQLKFQIKPVSPVLGRPLLIGLCVFCLITVVYFTKRWNQEVYYFKGFKAAKANKVEESYKLLEKAFDWFNAEVNTNYELGNSYSRYAQMLGKKGFKKQELKYKDKALEAYRAAIDANPGYDEIYFNLGISYSQLNRKEEAMRYLQMALFINPLLRDVYGSLSNLHASHGEFEKARDYLDQGIVAFPKDKEFWLNLGYMHTKLNEDEKAFNAYRKAYLLDPKFSQAWNNLRLVAQKLGRNEPLLEVPSLVERVEKAVAVKNYQAAYQSASRLVEILPETADTRISLGNVLFYLNQKEEAIKQLQKAIELGPTITVARLNLTQIYLSQNQLDLARNQLNEILKYDPNNKEARAYLEKL